MTPPGVVACSRRGPALTSWGKAAVVGVVFLVAAIDRTGSDTGALVAIVAAIVVACLVDGALAMAGFRAVIVSIKAPTTAHPGDEVATRIRFDGNDDLLATVPGYATVRPTAVDEDGVAAITTPVSRRSTFDEFLLQVLRPGPLGLAMATQRVVVPLAKPLVVLPPAAPAMVPLPAGGESAPTTEAWSARGHGSGPVQQLREHQHVDGLRSVNWPATARRGALVVAERDPAERGRTHVVVDLGDGCPSCGDEVVARARTVVGCLLARGDEVLITARTTSGARARPPRWPYGPHRLDLIPPEAETVEARSVHDAEAVLGRAVGGPLLDVAGPAYFLSPTGDRWDDGRG